MVKTLPSNAGGADLIPVQGTEIPHAVWCGKEKKKKRSVFKYADLYRKAVDGTLV